ncbi:43321_t:CDS:2, partial [Gigaspora margarita]
RIIQNAWRRFKEREPSNARLAWLNEIIPSKKQNPFVPRYPFRLLMSGEKCGHKMPKGVSKNFGERYIPCDDLIVVAQHQDEELWEVVQ